MFLKSSKGNINLSILLITFLICIAIALGVAFFHHYNSPSKFLEYKVSDISDKLGGVSDFPATANRMLNSDKSVSYIKLLDRNGVLEESFGNDTLSNTKRFMINGPGNKTIVLGLKPPANFKLDTYLLVWSLLIGSALALFLIFVVFMRNTKDNTVPTESMNKLEAAMDNISTGNYEKRIEISTSSNEDVSIINTYQSFNRMAESLNNKYDSDIQPGPEDLEPVEQETEYSELHNGSGSDAAYDNSDETADVLLIEEADNENDKDLTDEPEPEFVFNEEINSSEEQSGEVEFDLGADTEDEQIISDPDHDNFEEQTENQPENEQVITETVEEVSAFKPKIVLPQTGVYPKDRNVTVVVAKIDDFESLSQKLDSSDLSSFLTQYRKAASQIISSYGGVIEALLQDEIVAIFNAPDEQNNPELRAICASVEVLHELATMAKKRRADGKDMIAGKIGVGVKSLAYYSETGVPDSVKNVIKDARYVCENANLWKVYVTSELYELVNENVDAKEYLIEGEVLYSITGVEQGVVERDNVS